MSALDQSRHVQPIRRCLIFANSEHRPTFAQKERPFCDGLSEIQSVFRSCWPVQQLSVFCAIQPDPTRLIRRRTAGERTAVVFGGNGRSEVIGDVKTAAPACAASCYAGQTNGLIMKISGKSTKPGERGHSSGTISSGATCNILHRSVPRIDHCEEDGGINIEIASKVHAVGFKNCPQSPMSHLKASPTMDQTDYRKGNR